MKSKVLVVDDEWNMRNLVKIYLSRENFEMDEARDGNEALQMARQKSYDLLILDIMLPDIDGWEVCLTIRKTKQLPILMLTARDDIKDRVHGLNLGADDYLIKPSASEELVARVHALLRRHRMKKEVINEDLLHFEGILINGESREVMVKDTAVELTPKEFDILFVVASNVKRVFTREILLDKIWEPSDFRDLRAIDTHVKNIREKLRKAGLPYNPIKTVWGVRYKFNTQEDQP